MFLVTPISKVKVKKTEVSDTRRGMRRKKVMQSHIVDIPPTDIFALMGLILRRINQEANFMPIFPLRLSRENRKAETGQDRRSLGKSGLGRITADNHYRH